MTDAHMVAMTDAHHMMVGVTLRPIHDTMRDMAAASVRMRIVDIGDGGGGDAKCAAGNDGE